MDKIEKLEEKIDFIADLCLFIVYLCLAIFIYLPISSHKLYYGIGFLAIAVCIFVAVYHKTIFKWLRGRKNG